MIVAQAVGAALVAAASLAGIQTWRLHSLQTEQAEEKAHLQAERADAEVRARQAEQLMADGARKAAQTYAQHIDKARADAGGARTELDRLRHAIGTPPERDAAQDAAATAGADDATRARLVVGRCSAALQKLAEVADTCESRLTGLQEWAKAVATP